MLGYTVNDYFIICYLSAGAYTISFFCYNTAFQQSKIGAIIALVYLTVFYTFMFDTFIIGENFKSLEIVGITIILITSVIVSVQKQKNKEALFVYQR